MLALRLGRRAVALPGAAAALHTTPVVCAKSRRPRQERALAKAKQFAKALQAAPIGPAGPSTPPQFPETPQSLSLDDLLKLKPRTEANVRKGNYANKHSALVAAVDNAFVRNQLYALAQEMGLNPRQRSAKATIIQLILDSWGWIRPPPKEDGEWTRHIQVSTSQLFLLQRDPAVTAWLGSLEGVGLSVEPVEGQGELQGWLLIAKGRKDDLARLDSFLKQEQERHTVLQWPTDTMGGFKPTPATLWAVSVATGAHVEQVGWGKYVATGKTPAAAEAAKQMVLTIAERATAPYPPLGACIPPEDNVVKETPELYALVPHVPASSSPLPWDTSAIVAGRPLFRLRDVDTGNPGLLQAKHREAKLEGARVEALGNGESTSLRSIVERTLSQLPTDSTRTITFQFGHLLTPSKSTENDLEAPIPGSWPMEPTSPWHKLSTPVFSPALPPALIHFPLPQPRRIRRVTYRSEDGSQVSADYAYPQTVEEAVQMDQEDRPWIKEIDKMLARSTLPETKDGEMAFDFDALRGLIEADKPVPFHPLEVTARHTVSAVEDVLFPDRPTDMRIVARGESTVELPQLGDFFDKVHERAHSAAEIPLDDLKALRLGGEVPKNRAADVEEGHESGLEVEDMQETEVLPEPEVQPEPVADLESQHAEETTAEVESEAVESSAEVSEASETSPRPQPPQPQPEPITPPPTLELNGKLFKLQQDAIIELSESAAPVDDQDVAKPILRTLAVADLTGTGGVSRYAELQGRVGESLWRELASVSREVPPSSLGRGVRM